ncbi:hypothetical protein MKZ20_16710 [Psychrobacillus sp. FSL K6-2684]|uniref:Uncharacterized protein n=1 Tax=Psychrobacillus faecigallinarum TaxID=2762235 RepID=A0ABR8REE0_9BACI|nr:MULTISPECIES: hypothetical protein [Psychrobacillus]MBD7945907.1 hypothetical protein [Psychrobacillus faecigallinarum]QGM29018.1 hypothetical protein GI482_00685 [Bacillus sp. N3536]
MFNKVIESIWKSIDTKEKNYEEINKTYYAKDEVLLLSIIQRPTLLEAL